MFVIPHASILSCKVISSIVAIEFTHPRQHIPPQLWILCVVLYPFQTVDESRIPQVMQEFLCYLLGHTMTHDYFSVYKRRFPIRADACLKDEGLKFVVEPRHNIS